MSEFTLTAQDPSQAPKMPDLNTTGRRRPPTKEEREAVAASARAAGEAAQLRERQETAVPPAAPREDVESVEVQLPDGRTIMYGPPAGVSLSIRVAEFLGEQTQNPVLAAITRIILCVRSIDGQPVRSPGSLLDVKKIAASLGDSTIDLLGLIHAETWPPITKDDLPVLKKNLRQR